MIGTTLSLLLALAPAQAGAPGRCDAPPPPGSMQLAVRSGGTVRQVLVHVPAKRIVGGPLPLLINLHGSGSRGAEQLASSGLAATADRHGFLVAAPDGGIPHDRGHVWNIPGVPTVSGAVPGPGDADDTEFVAALIDTAAERLCADPARVYATGLSGGGRMASWLGCVLSDRIAAIAPVVGLRAGRARQDDETRVDPASCTPNRAVPVLAFAGAADRTNPIAGGEGARWGYSMHAAEQRWAAINGCTAPPFARWIDADTWVEGYADCRDGSSVTARVDAAGGHSWDVVDNDALWAFLARHRLPDR